MVKLPAKRWGASSRLADDNWMPLGDVIRWIAWRDAPGPSSGSENLGRGGWVDHGDLGEGDQKKLNEAADELRDFLSKRLLRAVGQRSFGSPEDIDPSYWAKSFNMAITGHDFRLDDWRVVLLDRAEVHSRWPSLVHKGRGRPIETDWGKIREFALSALLKRPGIKRSPLADSLVEEYRAIVGTPAPSKRTIEKKLKEWGLPTPG